MLEGSFLCLFLVYLFLYFLFFIDVQTFHLYTENLIKSNSREHSTRCTSLLKF